MLTDLLARLSPRQIHALYRLLRIRLADAHEWLPCPCGATPDTEEER
jgi:hypothetical protein